MFKILQKCYTCENVNVYDIRVYIEFTKVSTSYILYFQ